jgi:hypothetical protein
LVKETGGVVLTFGEIFLKNTNNVSLLVISGRVIHKFSILKHILVLEKSQEKRRILKDLTIL